MILKTETSYICSKYPDMTLLTIFLFKFMLLFAAPKGDNIPASIYDFKVEALTGGTIDFARFKGKKLLIVNTASECGNTPQYADLEALYKKYDGKLVIVGFPANDFGKQEPGNNQEIHEFCTRNYSVTFPMGAKITVKGENMAPIYKWLTGKKYNGFKDSEVKWNFQKYLINEKGQLVDVIEPGTKPNSPQVIAEIEKK